MLFSMFLVTCYCLYFVHKSSGLTLDLEWGLDFEFITA